MDNHSHRLPPLDSLKGFEAAARHLSFTRAAAELFLTQSAVSRQVQSLEEALGVRLFRRCTRRLELTPEGELLRRATIEALARLREVCAGLRAKPRRLRVTISSVVGVASLWLVPRLAAFQEIEPDLDVMVSADNRLVDLDMEGIDLGLRYGPVESLPAQAVRLFEEVVFPVAAPDLAAQLPAALRAEDLAGLTLIDFDESGKLPWLSWEEWLRDMGLGRAQPKAVLRFNQYDQVITAALAGHGIALGRSPLVSQLLAKCQLAPLAGGRRLIPGRVFFVARSSTSSRPEVERFVAWLQDEAHKTLAAEAR
jgi:DNA-binding transcriptional LysR family regulator